MVDKTLRLTGPPDTVYILFITLVELHHIGHRTYIYQVWVL